MAKETKIKTSERTKEKVVVALLMVFAVAAGGGIVALLLSLSGVASVCDDANVRCVNGPSDPYTTIQSALDAPGAYTTVLIYPSPSGIYTLPANPGSIRITKPGITVKGTSRDGVVIDGVNLPRLVMDTGNTIVIDGKNGSDADNVVLEDLTIIRGQMAGVRVSLVDHVTVRNLRILSSVKWGIVTDFAENIIIEDNYIDRTEVQHDIYVANSADNPIVRRNTLANAKLSGLQFNGDCQANPFDPTKKSQNGMIEDGLIEGNNIYGSGLGGLSIISAPRTRIQNNILHDNGIDGGAGSIHLTDQPAQDGKPACNLPSNDSVVTNNTIVEPRIKGIRMGDGATRSMIFNNLIVLPGQTDVANRCARDDAGGNFIDGPSNLCRGSADGLFDTYSNNGNSLDDDLSLVPTSPAVNSTGKLSFQSQSAPSVDVINIRRGSPYDIGAYEYKMIKPKIVPQIQQ